MPVAHLTVTPAEDGQKLFQFLQRRLGKDLPRPLIMRWVRTGQLRIDGKRAQAFDRLAAGQVVRVPPHDAQAPQPAEPRQRPPLPIVYEDAELVVVAKPSGLSSQPNTAGGDSAITRIKAMYAGSDFAPALGHRLDKETSGLLLAGKTYAAVRRLHDLFSGREVRKTYLAWVRGDWPETGAVTLQDHLVKVGRASRRATETADSGKLALARVRPLVRKPDATLLAVELLTGRTHQIRVQLSSRGHPILGDRRYGSAPHSTPMLLHAWRVAIPGHVFELPPDWPAAWQPL